MRALRRAAAGSSACGAPPTRGRAAQAQVCVRTAGERGLGLCAEAAHQAAEILGRSPPMLVPAGLFVMQQVLVIVAASYLDAVTFQICSQSFKIMPTALFAVWLLGQRLAPLQWASLPVLAVGVVFVTLNGSAPPGAGGGAAAAAGQSDLALGLAASSLAGLSSAYAGARAPRGGPAAAPCAARAALGAAALPPPAAWGVQVTLGCSGTSHQGCAVKPRARCRARPPPLGAAEQPASQRTAGARGARRTRVTAAPRARAGVYFEKYVKGRHGQSLWIRNLQLSIYGVPLAVAYTYMRDGRRAGHARCDKNETDACAAALSSETSASREGARRSSDACVSEGQAARGTAAHRLRAPTCTKMHAHVVAARLCQPRAQRRSTGYLGARPQGQPRARCARRWKGVRCEEGAPAPRPAWQAGLQTHCARGRAVFEGGLLQGFDWLAWAVVGLQVAPRRLCTGDQLRMAARAGMHTAVTGRLQRDAQHTARSGAKVASLDKSTWRQCWLGQAAAPRQRGGGGRAAQVFGGLIVGMVVKYADNILKNFANALSVILTVIGAAPLFGQYPSPWFIVGAAAVMLSVYMYSQANMAARASRGPTPPAVPVAPPALIPSSLHPRFIFCYVRAWGAARLRP